MAEASIEIPFIPENIEPEIGGVKRDAAEKMNSSNGGIKILSRYLKASTGSCHDFCKFGRKHAVEAKSRTPMRKSVTKRHGEGQDVDSIVSEGRKIKFASSPKTNPDFEAKKPDNLAASKKKVSSSSRKAGIPSKEDLSALEGIYVSVEEDPNDSNLKLKQLNMSSLSGQRCSINEGNFETKRSKAPSLEGPSGEKTSKIRSKEMRKLGDRKPWVPPTVPLSSKRSVTRVSGTVTRTCKNLKRVSYLKSQNKIKNPEPDIIGDVPEKTLYIIESTLENRTLEPAQDVVHTPQLSTSSSSTTQSPPSTKKNSRSTRSGIHASRSPTSLAPRNKDHRLTRHEILSAKLPLSSLQSSSLSSSTAAAAATATSPSENLDSKEENGVNSLRQTKVTQKKMVNLQAEHKNRTLRRTGKLVSENKNCPVEKMKFRRGTILDLKPENNTPRRLKFRRAKLLGEIQKGKGDIKKKSFESSEVAVSEFCTKTKPAKVVLKNQTVDGLTTIKRTSLGKKETSEGELIGTKANSEKKVVLRHQNVEATTTPMRRSFRRKEINGSELSSTKTNSERVVLRHQNVAGKKSVQSLFNNVIEETASKLVETRKSKVKALVGAFETVISLQDTRPPATAGAC